MGSDQTYTGDITPKGSFVNPYFRFYTSGALTGFYLEGFLRYYNYTYLVPYDYEKNESTIRANLDGTADGFGGGLPGGQFALAPRLYLDVFAACTPAATCTWRPTTPTWTPPTTPSARRSRTTPPRPMCA
ncbi:MAG: hypothetical protein R2810_03680 [Flavobacteriales bacterium]